MTLGNVPQFEADWACFCGSIIGVRIPVAVVASQAGYEVMCKHCSQWYRVRETGAEALDRTNHKEDTSEALDLEKHYRVDVEPTSGGSAPLRLFLDTDGGSGPGGSEVA